MKKIKWILAATFISSVSFAEYCPVLIPADTTKPVTKTAQATKDSNVLVVIDGKVIGTMKDVRSIDELVPADSISYVNIIKGSQATDKYGEKAKDGVVEIFTKANLKEVLTNNGEAKDNHSNEDNLIFDKVEVGASFPGGTQAWRNFLERTLNANIPVNNGAPAGSYTVVIQFIVDKKGEISDLKALTNHGYGMEKEVIRVLKKSPNWTPAMQNGRVVRAYRKQPVTFFISEEGPKKKN